MNLHNLCRITVLCMVGLAFLVSGCQHLASKVGYQKIEVATQAIEQARAESAAKIEELKTQQATETKNLIMLKDANAQKAAGDLYGAIWAFETIQIPTRTESVMGFRTKSAYARLPAPTPEMILSEMEEVKKELNEALVSNAELSKKYDAKVAEATKAKQEIEAKEAEISQLLTKIQQAKDEAALKERELQEARQKITEKELQVAAKKAEDEEREHKEKMWIIATLTFAAVAAGAAAIFLPIPGIKKNLGIFAACCIGIAIAVPFIKTWMIVTAFAGGVVIFGFPLIRNYFHEYKDATATYRALQRNKDKDPEAFKKGIGVDLAQWHSTYKKDKTGNVVVTPDTAISQRIDQRLVETEEK